MNRDGARFLDVLEDGQIVSAMNGSLEYVVPTALDREFLKEQERVIHLTGEGTCATAIQLAIEAKL